jgi:voltage-gated potassium channel Kch
MRRTCVSPRSGSTATSTNTAPKACIENRRASSPGLTSAAASDRPEATDRVVSILKEAFPGTPCVVRSFDRRHSLRLLACGVVEVRETFESALAMGLEALVGLGVPRAEAEAAMQYVRVRDRKLLEAQLRSDAAGFLDRYRIRPEPLEKPRP